MSQHGNTDGHSLKALVWAGLCLTLLTACASPAPPSVSPPPAPPLAIAPRIGLSDRVVDLAASYASHTDRARSLSSAFQNADEVASELRQASAYKVSDFEAGAIAYGAVVALQDPAFITAISAYARDPGRRPAFAELLFANPASINALASTRHAADQVVAAIDGHGQALFSNGLAIKQSAYSIQHQAWSKTMVNSRPQRLAQVKALGEQGLVSDRQTANLIQRVSSGPSRERLSPQGAPERPGQTNTALVTRALAVAALAVLGEVRNDHDDQALGLMQDGPTHRCLTMAKLNLYQCLAVAGPHYEDVFCMGQHAVKDTGQCLIEAAGAPIDPALLAENARLAATNRAAAMAIPTLAATKTARAKRTDARKRGR